MQGYNTLWLPGMDHAGIATQMLVDRDLARRFDANTYVVLTSDNGFHLGQHRLPAGKETAYEEDIHVPFVVRGPKLAPHASSANSSNPTDASAVSTQACRLVSARSKRGRLCRC